jgi:Holliday junction resolvase RusA-like endonuclease
MTAVGVVRRVIVPSCPDERLSPNARVHRMERYRVARDYRALAKYAALQDGPVTPMMGPVSVTVRVLWPKRRKLNDADNALASCKAALDGLVDAGILGDDRQVRRMTIEQEKLDKAGNVQWPAGCVTFDFEEVG